MARHLMAQTPVVQCKPGASVARSLVARNRDLLEALAHHPWAESFAAGTLPDQALIAWAGQCALFCSEEGRVLSLLQARRLSPRLDAIFARLAEDTVREPTQLADALDSIGAAPAPVEPWPVGLGYSSYVIATASAGGGIAEGICLIYAIEVARRATWLEARETADPHGRWFSWVENWSSPEFCSLVDDLGECLDTETGPVLSPDAKDRLRRIFRFVLRWELAFWDMCWTGQDWPAGAKS